MRTSRQLHVTDRSEKERRAALKAEMQKADKLIQRLYATQYPNLKQHNKDKAA